MYRINKVISCESDQIEIIPFGDVHFGSPNCNLKKFKDLINYISLTPNCYAIGMGDYWDCITHQDKRFDPDNSFEVMDKQYEDFKDIIEPIRHKLICLLTGNHEYKLHTAGIGDLTKRLSSELGVPYAGFSSFIKIKITPKTHQRSLMIYAHHGWSASRKSGGVINAVENLAQYYEADLYLVGHSHHLSSSKRSQVNYYGSRDILFCNTGSFLETSTWGRTSYSERANYPPNRLGVVKIKYYPIKGRLYATE